jgi:nitrogen regulatory protein PII
MKMILMMADASRLESVKADLGELGAPGYTVLPIAEGAGRSGVHSGDRVHPGALAVVMVIDEDLPAARLFDGLAKRRDSRGDDVSRMFLMPVERQS